MAQTYRLSGARRLVNVVVKPLARLGLVGPHTYVLTVRDRRTGKLYESPVTLIENGDRWLVAPTARLAGSEMPARLAKSSCAGHAARRLSRSKS
jgi:hypothetical protein